MKKFILGFIVVIIAVAGGAAYYLNTNLDGLIKAAVEKYGSAAIQADVRLKEVKLSLTNGEGAFSDLRVGNPKGFSTADAVSVGTVSVKVDKNSITSGGPIIVNEIVVQKPQVSFEANNNGESNLQTLSQNTQHNASVASGKAGDNKKESGTKVIIKDLYIRDGQIEISQPLLKQPLSAALPVIHLSDLGKDNGGVTPSQVADAVLHAISMSATKVASNALAEKLGGKLGGQLGDVQKAVPDKFMDKMGGLLGK